MDRIKKPHRWSFYEKFMLFLALMSIFPLWIGMLFYDKLPREWGFWMIISSFVSFFIIIGIGAIACPNPTTIINK